MTPTNTLHAPTVATYGTCTTKHGKRRTKAEMEMLRQAVYDVCYEHQPLTVRQCFYRLVVAGVIQKTQNEYKNACCKIIGQLRDESILPFDWIVDNTRWMRKPRSWDGLPDMLAHQQQFYRRNLWQDQDAYVEIWCESDSAAGVLFDVTREWDVPLMPARGFSSRTFLYSAAQTIAALEKPTFVYYFGDYDPSGLHIDTDICRKLEQYGAGDFEFSRIAVTEQQIADWHLPGAPPKKSDSRSRNFKGRAVELESIPPADLRELCRDCIVEHIDSAQLTRSQRVERAERETLTGIIEQLEGAA